MINKHQVHRSFRRTNQKIVSISTIDNQVREVVVIGFITNIIGYDFRNYLRKFFAPIILFTTIFLTACNKTGLDQVSVKKVKNEVTGEIEEYRSIKISEDELNDYSLEVRIPEGYQEYGARYSKDDFVYEFVKEGEASQLFKKSVFSIGKIFLVNPKNYSLSDYANLRDIYFVDKFRPNLRIRDNDNWKKVENLVPKSISIFYEYDCPNFQTVCFSNEKGVFVLKIFEGKNFFWTVEYSVPIVLLPSYRSRDEVIKTSKDIIENCCKIIAVKKPTDSVNSKSQQ